MVDLARYALAVFDSDGVILDSNRLKTEAFAQAVDDQPQELVERFLQYHRDNGGVSRYEKFRWFYRQLKGLEASETELAGRLERFASSVRDGLLACAMVPGVESVLRRLNDLGIPCYVNSGSDREELIEVYRVRGLDRWFRDIHGSPDDKVTNMQAIIKAAGDLQPRAFFGDSRTDLEAAESFHCDFVFVRGCSAWPDGESLSAQFGAFIIEDFTSLENEG